MSPCARIEISPELKLFSLSLDSLTFIKLISSTWHGFVPSAHSDIQAS